MSESEDKSAASPVDAGKARKAMKQTLALVKKLGTGAVALLKKLRKDRSPEAMSATLDVQLSANRVRREEISGQVERLYNEIAAKKKAYATAPKARQRILEAELKSLLSTYKTAERELGILLENEKNLGLVKGRLNEVTAYGMAGVSEAMIDDVIDEIEEKVSEAEGVGDASRDLEKAGKRRERESDTEDLWEQLGDFDADQAGAGKDIASDFEVEKTVIEKKEDKKAQEETPE